MIGCFPELGNDEILMSGCARYARRLRYRTSRWAIRDLFGNRVRRIDTNFPRHLNNLVTRLLPGHAFTVENIIERHTLVPYYRPFRNAGWETRVKRVMVEEQTGWGRHTERRLDNGASQTQWLRYCPICFEHDQQIIGEAYWHRIHQVPGVLVCPTHHVFLEESSVRVYLRHPDEELVTLEEACRSVPSRPLQSDHPDHRVLLRLAQDIRWVIEHSQKLGPSEHVYQRLRMSLWKYWPEQVSNKSVFESLRSQAAKAFSPHVLSLLGCQTSMVEKLFGSYTAWMNHNRGHSPLLQVLSLQLLGHSAESFSALSPVWPAGAGKEIVSDKLDEMLLETRSENIGASVEVVFREQNSANRNRVAGYAEMLPRVPLNGRSCMSFAGEGISLEDGPWPCMNKAAKHFGQPVLTQCLVVRRGNYRIRRVFSCSCGFVFVANNPDGVLRSEGRLGRVISYGLVWDKRLTELWSDRTRTLKNISATLGVDIVAMKHQASRLGLSLPRHTIGAPRKVTVPPPLPGKTRKVNVIDLSPHRTAILQARQDYPDLSRTELRMQMPHSYDLLWRKDREWMQSHLPSVERRTITQPQPSLIPVVKTVTSSLESIREQILSLRDRSPHRTRRYYWRTLSRDYVRLRREDPVWLDAQLPSVKVKKLAGKGDRSPVLSDAVKDERLALKIREAAVRIKERAGKPTQITRQLLVRECHLNALPMESMYRLPRTTCAIAELVESIEAIAIRRIRWAAKWARANGTGQRLTATYFRDQAGVSRAVLRIPAVDAVVKEEIQYRSTT